MRALAFVFVAAALGPTAAAPKPLLHETFDVAVEPRGTLLVSDVSNRVFRVRGRKLTVVARAGFPVEVAVDPRGGFGIVSLESRIRLVDARGRITTLARGLAQPTALSFDALGNVYFSELGGRVLRIDRASRAVTKVATGFNRPHGQVVVGDTLYVCDTFSNRLVAIDLRTKALTATEGFNQPVDVALEPSGSLVVADYGNNRVARVSGGTVTTVAMLLGPQSVAVARSGTIYATELHLSRVRAVNPVTGAVRTVIGSP
jgi:DNA-binding beta-propeller fold protein YncE